MRPRNFTRGFPVVLVASLALSFPIALRAQEPPGLSSGSGEGTGTGRSSGIQRNQSGSSSGVGPSRPGQEMEGPVTTRRLPSRMSVPRGPGVGVQFPNDPGLGAIMGLSEPSGSGDPNLPSGVTDEILNYARKIADPGDRSRALLDIARTALLSNQLLLAHRTLEEASASALEVSTPLVHDQLLIAIITQIATLTDALISERRTQTSLIQSDQAPQEPLPKRKIDESLAVRLSRLEWKRGIFLAREIINPTYRSEYQERVLENMASGAGRIATEYSKSDVGTSAAPRITVEQAREFKKIADQVFIEAEEACTAIERPIWRNFARVKVAVAAGESFQFARALSLALAIENSEARCRALLLIAESQARHDDPAGATQTYSEVASSVVEVPQEGLRAVLVGFFLDSMISTGRFDDARACTVLYPTESDRYVALGTIAEAQGFRGAAASARRWIEQEAPPAYRAALARQVNNGVLRAIAENRSREITGRGDVNLPGR